MKTEAKKEKLVIGFAEYVDLPDFGVRGLRAKIDTGARTSALHVENIEVLPGDRVRFEIRLHRHRSDRRIRVEAPITRTARVRPSSGHTELRTFVSTTIRVGTLEKRVELSLVDRGPMIFRMLIGRTALNDDFMVDPSKRYFLTQSPRPRKRKSVY